MRNVLSFLLCFLSVSAFAQEPVEKEVKTEVSEVTVYLENALETRKASVDVLPGKTVLKFIGLSPYVDAKSIQARMDGEVTLLTVNHQQNFLDKPEQSVELKELKARMESLKAKKNVENAYLEVIAEDMAYLQENRRLGGNQSISVAAIKEGSDFFSTKLTSLKIKQLERNATLKELQKQLDELVNQYQSLAGQKVFATGEVLVLVEAKKTAHLNVDLSYLVTNASWYPSYDIRVKNITEPLSIVYKANIRQDTKNDWKNVRLKLSSYNPTVSGVAPELQAYILDYNSRPPVYNKAITTVSGRVCDDQNLPLAGVTVKVKGSNVATSTNARGNYSITLPANAKSLSFSYIGFNERTLTPQNETLNVCLLENQAVLSEVVPVMAVDEDCGVDMADLPDHQVIKEERKPRAVGQSMAKFAATAALPEQEKVEKPISVDFEIKTPYTIPSENKLITVDMDQLSLPSTYQYFCVPKINKEAFLTAQIRDWEKYSFLEGEANVFFEDTYVGKTILDIHAAGDTLSISLGRDKKVSVNREKVKAYTSKQLIGSKKEDTRSWRITVRNNRLEPISMVLADQVPVAANAEIEVTKDAGQNASVNAETGEVNWNFSLPKGQEKTFDLKYVVKYPKNRNLVIE